MKSYISGSISKHPSFPSLVVCFRFVYFFLHFHEIEICLFQFLKKNSWFSWSRDRGRAQHFHSTFIHIWELSNHWQILSNLQKVSFFFCVENWIISALVHLAEVWETLNYPKGEAPVKATQWFKVFHPNLFLFVALEFAIVIKVHTKT